MQYFNVHLHYFAKMFISAKLMFTKPAGIISLMPTITFALLTATQKVLVLLFCLFILDFITGIYASWCEKQQREKDLLASERQNLISSAKLRLSGVKAFTYCSATLSIYFIEKIFFIKSFKFEKFSDQDLTITVLAIGFFCAIEFYSIVFENFKRAGFDIVEKVKKIKATKSEITE